MSPALLTVSTPLTCPHGATVTAAPSATKAKIDGLVLTASDTFTIAGCPFTLPGGVPSPCVTVLWSSPAAKVTHGGAPALTSASVGLCLAATGAPQGSVTIGGGQTQVEAT